MEIASKRHPLLTSEPHLHVHTYGCVYTTSRHTHTSRASTVTKSSPQPSEAFYFGMCLQITKTDFCQKCASKAAWSLSQTLCEGDNIGCYLDTPSTCTRGKSLCLSRKTVLFLELPMYYYQTVHRHLLGRVIFCSYDVFG